MTTQQQTTDARLEHINVTVSDPERTAAMLTELFGWRVRWTGGSIHGGRTIHVGTNEDYLALYALPQATSTGDESYFRITGLNHIALVVQDLDAVEQRVLNAGFETTNHGDYEPGRRFYFRDHDNIEFEIVSYCSDNG